jgi:RNA polymerase sigma factor (sigma-70 family)
VRDFHKRVAHRYHFVVLEQATEVMDEGQNAPEAILLRKEAHSHLHMQLQSLSTRQQEILQLHFTGGLNCVEIAAVLRKREGTVRAMLSRALNSLRNMYKNGGTN